MQSMPNTRAAGMLVFTTVAWGAMFAVAKSALGTLDAFWLSTWRYIPAAVVMLAILWLVEGRGSLSPARRIVAVVGARIRRIRRFQHSRLPRPRRVAARACGDPRRADAADHVADELGRARPSSRRADAGCDDRCIRRCGAGDHARASRPVCRVDAACGCAGAGGCHVLGRLHHGCRGIAAIQSAALHGAQHEPRCGDDHRRHHCGHGGGNCASAGVGCASRRSAARWSTCRSSAA